MENQYKSGQTWKWVKHPNQHGGSFLFKAKKNAVHLFQLLGSMVLIATSVALYGMLVVPEHITATTITLRDTTKYPVLDRIAKCESHNRQFNTDGSVLTNTNTNGTVDVGMYQINMSSYHIKEIAKLNLNVFTEQGNRDYAMYIYTHYGTGAWSSSANCWNK